MRVVRFLYLECPVCQWNCVLPGGLAGAPMFCTLCVTDSGHEVLMQGREALEADKVEGCDVRQEPWA